MTINRQNIADIICCNIYVDEVVKKSSNHLKVETKIGIIDIIILTFKEALNQNKIYGERVYFDEFSFERDFYLSTELINLLLENHIKEVVCYFTSFITGLKKTLFDLVVYYLKNNRPLKELKKQLIHKYNESEIERHWIVLSDSLYVTDNSNITIEEEYVNTIDTRINKVTSYTDLFTLEQSIFNSCISKDLYGFFFDNAPLYKRLNIYATKRINKVKEKLKETNRPFSEEK